MEISHQISFLDFVRTKETNHEGKMIEVNLFSSINEKIRNFF